MEAVRGWVWIFSGIAQYQKPYNIIIVIIKYDLK